MEQWPRWPESSSQSQLVKDEAQCLVGGIHAHIPQRNVALQY